MMPRLFTRGFGPFCSIMLPTRGRPQWLLESIDSVYSLAQRKDWLEFIVKVDTDDQASLDVCRKLKKDILGDQMKILVSSRGRGYLDMHLWVDWMFKESAGDWVLLFNDDARIKSQDWDAILAQADADGVWHGIDEMCLLCAETIGRPFDTEFFFARRGIFDVLGHISLSPHNDNWIWQVMSMVGSSFTGPIKIDHLSDRGEDDLTRLGCREAFKTSTEEFKSAKMTRARLDDGMKLMNWIDQKLAERAKK